MVSSNSPKKRTNEFVVVVKMNSFVFWKNSRIPKVLSILSDLYREYIFDSSYTLCSRILYQINYFLYAMDLENYAVFIIYYRVNFSIIVKILETFKMWCFTIRNTMKYQWCFLSPNAFLVKEKLPSKSVVTGTNEFSFLGSASVNWTAS